ncbi:MAG TPA: sugar transferase [Candidatus Paceibacterota bacterium]|nr:sugar transferase [Candidatus Paceibacterota bacterium]
MTRAFRPRKAVLFIGDLVFFSLALWLSLFLRSFDIPSQDLFLAHLAPFSILFLIWALVFFVAGLYESRSIVLARRALSTTLLVAQTINIAFAAVFFSVIPYFGITPKTLLVIYLAVSFLLMVLWRAFIFPWLGLQKTENAILVGEGNEIDLLAMALNAAHQAPTRVARVLGPKSPTLEHDINAAVAEFDARAIIADLSDPHVSAAFSKLYNSLSGGIRFFDALALYEEVFGRVPLSTISDNWLALNVSLYADTLYDGLKRLTDIALAAIALVVSFVFYPFVAAAIKLEDGGAVIISMPRVGEGGRVFDFYKFRSMSGNDRGQYGLGGASKLHVTRVGKFLRSSHIDELPQLWNILKGDLSFVGPRPEFPPLVEVYEREIPYYGMRHLIKPGLSGWAQLYYFSDPHHATDVEATRMKLSYDLYYLKHRSLGLDLVVILKTIRRLFTKSNA